MKHHGFPAPGAGRRENVSLAEWLDQPSGALIWLVPALAAWMVALAVCARVF